MLAGCRTGARVELNDEEDMLVATVRAFIDRDVKPTVREVEHANEYPEAWIEQMKRIGIYGLAIPEEYGGSPVSMPCYVEVTQELARGWMSLAGAMGGHTVVAKLLTLFGTEDQQRGLSAGDGHRRAAGHHGADRAGRWFGSAEHDHHRSTGRSGCLGHQRLQDLDFERAPVRIDCAAVQDRHPGQASAQRAFRSCSSNTGRG